MDCRREGGCRIKLCSARVAVIAAGSINPWGYGGLPAAGNRHVYTKPAGRLGDPGHAACSRAEAGRQEGRIASGHQNSPRFVDHADDDVFHDARWPKNAYLAAQEEQSGRRPNQPT